MTKTSKRKSSCAPALKLDDTVTVKFDSSNLKAGRYNKRTKRLTIKFLNGSMYRYEDVSKSEFESLCSAESQGSCFSTTIKPHKKCVKLRSPAS